MGFLAEKERLNVALTRARFCLVVVGDSSTLATACPELWGELVNNARQRGRLLAVQAGSQVGLVGRGLWMYELIPVSCRWRSWLAWSRGARPLYW